MDVFYNKQPQATVEFFICIMYVLNVGQPGYSAIICLVGKATIKSPVREPGGEKKFSHMQTQQYEHTANTSNFLSEPSGARLSTGKYYLFTGLAWAGNGRRTRSGFSKWVLKEKKKSKHNIWQQQVSPPHTFFVCDIGINMWKESSTGKEISLENEEGRKQRFCREISCGTHLR